MTMFWPELIFVTNITNYIRGEKIFHVEKFQLSMYDNYGEIETLEKFGKNWEILPQFTRFHVKKNWAQKYISGEKMSNMRSGFGIF